MYVHMYVYTLNLYEYIYYDFVTFIYQNIIKKFILISTLQYIIYFIDFSLILHLQNNNKIINERTIILILIMMIKF